jgi:atypical dual specificity phosphatase
MKRLIARLLFHPTLMWNRLLLRLVPGRRWWDRIDDDVLLGALPSGDDAHALHAEGVRAVVNTCEEYGGPQSVYEELGIEQLRIPTIDFQPPTLADVERAVDFMRARVAEGKQVYVHCKAGRGRSATVVLCWLIGEKGMKPEEGFGLIRERRPHVIGGLCRRNVVKAFAAKQKA